MARYGMVIDRKQCLGCSACTLACKVEHGTPRGVFWHRVVQSEIGEYPSANRQYLALPCMHCQNAPCVDVCPTGASYKRPDGIVAVDYDKCMGCKYCETACPYGARTYVQEIKGYYPEFGLTPYEQVMFQQHQAGVVEKCNFCMERVAKGEEPACVQTCPAYARYFGDLDDPNSEVSRLIAERHGYQLMPELGTNPSVYYLPE
jgi:Fe-S-cluster-containing dehydrogenase component